MVELAVRMVVSLAVVVGLLLLIARVGQKRFKGRSGSPLQVVHRQSLSRGSGVALVSVGGRMLLLGTTDQQVQMLTEVDPADIAGAVAAPGEAPLAPAAAAAPAAPAAQVAPVVPDSLLGSMAGLVDEPTRWLQPRSAKKRAAVITEPVVASVPAPTAPAAPLAPVAPVAPAALAPVEEAQVASFAATLEAELEAELKAVVVPAKRTLSPAQVLLQEEQDHSPLAGSLLSPDTWRLAARAVSRRAS